MKARTAKEEERLRVLTIQGLRTRNFEYVFYPVACILGWFSGGFPLRLLCVIVRVGIGEIRVVVTLLRKDDAGERVNNGNKQSSTTESDKRLIPFRPSS